MLINEINKLRDKIDSIDGEILKLLCERKDCAVKIGQLKDELRKTTSTNKIGAYDPKREKEIIRKIQDTSSGLPFNGVEAIFREIMSMCRNAAHKTTVFFIDGFDIEQVAIDLLGRSCKYLACINEEEFISKIVEDEFNIGLLVKAHTSKTTIDRLLFDGFEIKMSLMLPDKRNSSFSEVYLITHS